MISRELIRKHQLPKNIVGVKQLITEESGYERKRSNVEIFEALICRSLNLGCYVEAISLIHNTIESYLKYRLGIKKNYLIDYAEDCKEEGLISEAMFEDIKRFNTNRNTTIHRLQKNKLDYKDLIDVVFEGRKIQLKLSPCKHTEKEIDKIIKIDKSMIKTVSTKEVMSFQNKRNEFLEDFQTF